MGRCSGAVPGHRDSDCPWGGRDLFCTPGREVPAAHGQLSSEGTLSPEEMFQPLAARAGHVPQAACDCISPSFFMG